MTLRRSRPTPAEQPHTHAFVGPRRRAPLALLSTLATLAALALLATPALAFPTHAVKVVPIGTGKGTVTSEPEGIECGNGPEACEANFEYVILDIALTAKPANERTAFAGWSGYPCSSHEGHPTTCEADIGFAREFYEFKARFTAIPQLKLTVATEGEGTVTGTSPGGEFTPIECGSTCEAEYNEGATITLFANRATHSKFTGWEGCPNVLSSPEYGTGECEVQMTEAKAVKAKFAPIPQHNLELEVTGAGHGEITSSPGGIACASGDVGTCTEHFDSEGPESTVTLFANHNERSTFTGWTGCEEEPSPTECKVTLSAAKSVKAQFAPIPQQTLTVATEGTGEGTITGTSPGGEFTPIECGSTCSAEYNEGATITLFANRATHSKFTGWEGCPNVLSSPEYGTGECEVQMTEAKAVKAKFAPIPQHNLELEVTGAGHGEITSSPGGIACASGDVGICTEHFDSEGPESTVTLFANRSNERTAFTGWSEVEGHPGTCTGTTAPCEVTLSEAIKLKAEFAPIPQQTLTVATEGEGNVTGSAPSEFTPIECGSTCSAEYNEGAEITLTANPAVDNQLKEWEGACSGTEPTCQVTISAAKSVKAIFTPALHTLTVTPTGSGEVTSSPAGIACGTTCEAKYQEGSAVTLKAHPAPHSQFHAWGGGGCADEPEPHRMRSANRRLRHDRPG